jgi:hypothetical protein
VHRILCRLNALLGHPNIAQTIGAERTTLFNTLLASEAGGIFLYCIFLSHASFGI